ncbi:MAG TPA: hypothetical protein VF101_05570 [Gaiellaceae bacterium]
MPGANWAKFLDLDGHPWENFEVLCYELVRRNYGQLGQLAFPRGEPGVEFHLRLDVDCELGNAGCRIGWQCKWFEGAKLTSSRRRQVGDSFKKAKAAFPDMTRWILWTRDALSSVDSTWVGALDSAVTVESWHTANVEGLMGGDAYILRQSFFGDLVLTATWFQHRYDEALGPIRSKYHPALHVAVEQEHLVHRLLGDSVVRTELDTWTEELGALVGPLREACADGEASRASLPTGAAVHLDAVLAAADELDHRLVDTADTVVKIEREVERGNFAEAASLASDVAELRWDDRHLRDAVASLDEALPEEEEGDGRRRHTRPGLLDRAIAGVWEPSDPHASVVYETLDVGRRLDTSLIAVLAEAGRGKTHFAAQVAGGFGDRDATGLLLHAKEFGASFTEHSLADHAGLPGRSLDDLLEAVNSAGMRANRRIAIVIDALNEAVEPKRWKDVLARVSVALPRFANVVVIVTLRPTYADWTITEDTEVVWLYGFVENLEDAVDRYFDHYKIDADRTIETLAQFEHPLFLSMFCQATNPRRETRVTVELGTATTYEIFEKYISTLELAVADRLDLDPADRSVAGALDGIARELWRTRARAVPVSRVKEIAGDTTRPWNASMTKALEDENVILRDVPRYDGGDEEVVSISYDLLGGWLIGESLIQEVDANADRLFENRELVEALVGEDDATRHPLADDVGTALAGLLPRRAGRNLWEATSDPALQYWATLDLFLLESEYVDDAAVAQVVEVFHRALDHPEARSHFFRLFRATRSYPSHPLNAMLFGRLLRQLDVWRRDLSWTEWLRASERVIYADIDRLERRWRESNEELGARDALLAEWLSWVLTTTSRPMRDRATRALYWFGRRECVALFRLTLESLDINDVYVPERMLAASYGTAIATTAAAGSSAGPAIGTYSQNLEKDLLSVEARVPTTHFLARDYAAKTVELTRRYPTSPLPADDVPVRPPFAHARREWSQIAKSDERYEDADWALHMDFENYTIGGLVRDRGNYDMVHPEYNEILSAIRWRIYDIGYRRERFADADRRIAEREWRRDQQPGRTERYGKKYSWIAYFEMAGDLADRGLLDPDDYPRPRLADADLDPSFPEPPPALDAILPVWPRPTPKDDRAWLRRGIVQIPDDLMMRTSVNGVDGSWVAVDGFLIARGNTPSPREVFTFVRGFLSDPAEGADLRERLASISYPGNYLIPEAGSDYYTYAGEIPWASTFAAEYADNGDEHERTISFRDGGSYRVEVLSHTYQWESHHSVLNQAGGALVPSPRFCEFFDLRNRPQTFDLFLPDGTKASASVSAPGGAERALRGHLLYLREDLLRAYADAQGQELSWLVWGERRVVRESWGRDERLTPVYAANQNVHRRVSSLRELVGDTTQAEDEDAGN